MTTPELPELSNTQASTPPRSGAARHWLQGIDIAQPVGLGPGLGPTIWFGINHIF